MLRTFVFLHDKILCIAKVMCTLKIAIRSICIRICAFDAYIVQYLTREYERKPLVAYIIILKQRQKFVHDRFSLVLHNIQIQKFKRNFVCIAIVLFFCYSQTRSRGSNTNTSTHSPRDDSFTFLRYIV